MTDFDRNSAFEIFDTAAFAHQISRQLVGFRHGMEGHCLYEDEVSIRRKIDFKLEDHIRPDKTMDMGVLSALKNQIGGHEHVLAKGITEASTVDMLTMPLQPRGGAMTQNQVVATALARGESWRPWASWLRDRFVGGMFYKLNSRYYSTIPAVLWPDAAKVNGWLVGATPSIEDQPLYEPVNPDAFEPNPDDIDAQETTSVSFTITDANQVHLDSEAGQSSLLDDQLSHDLHHELIERVTELESACASSNSLAELAVAILKFRSSLGRSPHRRALLHRVEQRPVALFDDVALWERRARFLAQ